MSIDTDLWQALLAGARFPEQLNTQIFATVMARTYAPGHPTRIAGLSNDQFQRLLQHHFPYFTPPDTWATSPAPPLAPPDEFAETLALLIAHRNENGLEETWLAHAIATASLSAIPLWQALGLPGKPALSGLMQRHFHSFYRRNRDNLPWKRMIYREIARAAGIGACQVARCADCAHLERCQNMDAAEQAAAPPTASLPRPLAA